jgi:transcription-repair coupling factor (superfamily II helicase)
MDDLTHGWLRRAVTQPEFAARLAPLAKGDREIVLDHSAEASHAFLTAVVHLAAKDQQKSRLWLVCDLPRHRERLAAELELWGISALTLPECPVETGEGSIADPESAAEWFAVLEVLARSESCVVVCGSDAFAGKAPSPAALRASRTPLKSGTLLDPVELAKSLADHGYERTPTVTGRGQFAVRGGILDLFGHVATGFKAVEHEESDERGTEKHRRPVDDAALEDLEEHAEVVVAVEDEQEQAHADHTDELGREADPRDSSE